MASRQDMQDIMGLPAGGTPTGPVQKRPKIPPPAKRMTGISREVVALMGERPPPVAIYDEKKAYKARRKTGPAKKWAQTPFYNPARRDDLILRHWRRKGITSRDPDDPDITMEDAENLDLEMQDPVQVQRHYEFSQYNVQVDVPEYTSEEYEEHLKSDDWSREETDYLFTLVQDYSYRWPAIWDRYDFQPPEVETDSTDPSTAVAIPRKERTMEELKHRFYSVQAVLMTLKNPISNMTGNEFSLHETLSKYNVKTETDRKALAAALLVRSREEVVEEEFLLVELQRICASAERLESERDEIRAVHEAPSAAASTSQFQSSQALGALFSQLFQQDRSKKRQSAGIGGGRLSLNTSELMTPSGITPPHHRDSLVSATTAGGSGIPRKGAPPHQPSRILSPATERRFGVTTHDRLQSGVAFRSDKMLKLRQAKSQAQTLKLTTALTELGVPDLIVMNTQATYSTFEKLIGKVGKLLELRKVREKEEAEYKVVASMVAQKRRDVEGKGGDAGASAEQENDGEEQVNGEQDTKMEENEDDDEEQEQEDNAEDNGDNDSDADHNPDEDEDNDEDDNDNDVDASEIPDLDADADADDDDDDDDDPDNTMDLDPNNPANQARPSSQAGSNSDAEDQDQDNQSNDEEEEDDEDDDDPTALPSPNESPDADADADGETETNGIASTRGGSLDTPQASTSANTRSNGAHKRSASVLSAVSRSSGGSRASRASKRVRKGV